MLLAAGSFLSQMMLLLGMLLLAWVLVRRNIQMRRRSRAVDRQLRMQRASGDRPPGGAPLADAPKEVLRWQAAMFDLQRDLKAELDTRISVVQSLLRQVDQRIDELRSVQQRHDRFDTRGLRDVVEVASEDDTCVGELSAERFAPEPTGERSRRVRQLFAIGFTPDEIAEKSGIPLAEVELFLGSSHPMRTSSPML